MCVCVGGCVSFGAATMTVACSVQENEKDDLNVYVRNLPRRGTFTNSDLEELFKEYGQVVSVKLLQSDNQYTGRCAVLCLCECVCQGEGDIAGTGGGVWGDSLAVWPLARAACIIN